MVKAALQSTGVIAIIRGVEGPALEKLVAALYKGGIRLAEITMNTNGALQAIGHLREQYGDTMYIGAGTVTDPQRAQDALDAGAQFIVTPNVNTRVIQMCLERNILITPGALTPTEIFTAMELGCEYVKLFPARSMGPAYIKDVLAPLNTVKLLVVGGVDVHNIGEYLRAGAVGAGIGGSLCRTPEDGDYSAITQKAAQLMQLCRCGGKVE